MARIVGLIETMKKAVIAFRDAERVIDEVEQLPPQDINRVLGHLQEIVKVCDKLDEIYLVKMVERIRDGNTDLTTELIVLKGHFRTMDLWTALCEPEAAKCLRRACDRSRRGYLEETHGTLKAIGRVPSTEDLTTFKKRLERMRRRQKSVRFVVRPE